jgi:hypothetical protein
MSVLIRLTGTDRSCIPARPSQPLSIVAIAAHPDARASRCMGRLLVIYFLSSALAGSRAPAKWPRG